MVDQAGNAMNTEIRNKCCLAYIIWGGGAVNLDGSMTLMPCSFLLASTFTRVGPHHALEGVVEHSCEGGA